MAADWADHDTKLIYVVYFYVAVSRHGEDEMDGESVLFMCIGFATVTGYIQ